MMLLTEKELLDIVDTLIRDRAYNKPAAVAIGMAVGAAVEAEVRERLRAENDALKRDLQYARDGLTKGRTRMREDNERLRVTLAACMASRDALRDWAQECRNQVLYLLAQQDNELGRVADGLGQASAGLLGPNVELSRREAAGKGCDDEHT